VIETSPEVLLTSRRIDPFTESVRSKLPVTEGPTAQPTAAIARTTDPVAAMHLRYVIDLPLRFLQRVVLKRDTQRL